MAAPPLYRPAGVGDAAATIGLAAVGAGVAVGMTGDGVIVITRAVGGGTRVALLNGFRLINPPNPIRPHTPNANPMSGPSHQAPPPGRRVRDCTRRTG